MSIRLQIDYRRWLVHTQFSGDIGLPAFGRYARELAKLPVSDVPLILFADGTKLNRFRFSLDQMLPHAEQIIARLAHGQDMAAVILLAASPHGREFAFRFREIAADSFPVEVYGEADPALDRLNALLHQPPIQRRVPA